MGLKVLVTGGSGMLGNHVSPFLKEQGHQVTNFDIKPPAKGSANDLACFPFVRGSLLSLSDCLRAIAHAQPDVIVHLAAIPHNSEIQPAYAMEYDPVTQDGVRFMQTMDEDETMKTNTMGTYYLLDAARRLGVKKVVFISSLFVLGIGFRISGTPFVPEYLPIDENHPCSPEDTYSLSKLLDEQICRSFASAYGMQIVALRLFGVFYPDSEFHQKIYKFNINVPPAKNEKAASMFNGIYQYVDARDAARAVGLAMTAENLRPFEAFFLSTDTTFQENTTEVIAKRWPAYTLMGRNIAGTDGLVSIEKAKRLLGYQPAFSWRNRKQETRSRNKFRISLCRISTFQGSRPAYSNQSKSALLSLARPQLLAYSPI